MSTIQSKFVTSNNHYKSVIPIVLIYDMVKAHGGHLKVAIKANEGGEFIIILITI